MQLPASNSVQAVHPHPQGRSGTASDVLTHLPSCCGATPASYPAAAPRFSAADAGSPIARRPNNTIQMQPDLAWVYFGLIPNIYGVAG